MRKALIVSMLDQAALSAFNFLLALMQEAAATPAATRGVHSR
jgi:hypothetical protein